MKTCLEEDLQGAAVEIERGPIDDVLLIGIEVVGTEEHR